MRSARLAALLAAALALAGCRGAGRAVAWRDLCAAPGRPAAVAYGPHAAQRYYLVPAAPVEPETAAPRTAVVFLHGGGWQGGEPALFFPHARYLAQRGAVGVSLGYRRATRDGAVTVLECLADVRRGVAALRARAGAHGIDAERLVLAGDSAGGHLAAAAVLCPAFRDAGGEELAPTEAAALALFNPVLDLQALAWARERQNLLPAWAPAPARAAPARWLSPAAHVRPGLPPVQVQHGRADRVVPAAQARAFCRALREAGGRCELRLWPGTGHAFVLPGYGSPRRNVAALRKLDRFLNALDLVSGPPTLRRPRPEPRAQGETE